MTDMLLNSPDAVRTEVEARHARLRLDAQRARAVREARSGAGTGEVADSVLARARAAVRTAGLVRARRHA
jgi:hypothetical protein